MNRPISWIRRIKSISVTVDGRAVCKNCQREIEALRTYLGRHGRDLQLDWPVNLKEDDGKAKLTPSK